MLKVPEDMAKGAKHSTRYYGEVQVVEYIGCKEVSVAFLRTNTVSSFPAGDIRRGFIKDPTVSKVFVHKTPEDMKVGSIHNTTSCGKVEVLCYQNRYKVLVKFMDSGEEVITDSTSLRGGFVRDLNKIRYVYGGVGINDMINPNKYIYDKWRSMLRRCYVNVKSCYEKVTVCEEWKILSNFHNWMGQQDYNGLVLDKDLKSTTTKIYSPDTCVFIPDNINSFLIRRRSGGCKQGVYLNKDKGMFQAQVTNPLSGKTEYLGRYLDEDLAHTAYITRKYEICEEVCSTLKDKELAELVMKEFEY